jgi:hypothetical protein
MKSTEVEHMVQTVSIYAGVSSCCIQHTDSAAHHVHEKCRDRVWEVQDKHVHAGCSLQSIVTFEWEYGNVSTCVEEVVQCVRYEGGAWSHVCF